MGAQVQPPLTERKHITTFISALKRADFKKLVKSITTNFSYLIIMRGQLEYAIRHGKLTNDSTKFIDSSTKKHTPSNKKENDSPVVGKIATTFRDHTQLQCMFPILIYLRI